jgi:hypothetical protein
MVQDKHNNTANEALAGPAPRRCSIISKGLPPA